MFPTRSFKISLSVVITSAHIYFPKISSSEQAGTHRTNCICYLTPPQVCLVLLRTALKKRACHPGELCVCALADSPDSSSSDAALSSNLICAWLLLAFAHKPGVLIFYLSPNVLDHRLNTLLTHHFPVLTVHHRFSLCQSYFQPQYFHGSFFRSQD